MPTDYHVRLRAPDDASDPLGIRRVRAALKRLWRAYGLRCIEARQVDPSPDLIDDPTVQPFDGFE